MSGETPGVTCVRVGASTGDHLGVHVEQTPIGVQEVLLVGDQLIANRHVGRRLRGGRWRCGNNSECRYDKRQNYTKGDFVWGSAEQG